MGKGMALGHLWGDWGVVCVQLAVSVLFLMLRTQSASYQDP